MRLLPLGQRKSLSGSAGSECCLLEICNLQLLLECPLDLSALSLFLPTLVASDIGKKKVTPSPQNKKQKAEVHSSDSKILIDSEPWYKTADLTLLDIGLLNAVIISNPESMLGLPFLTRDPAFTAKVFATEATATIGKLMMRELVSFHSEYVKLYGRLTSANSPCWAHGVQESLKEYVVGEYGSAIGNWHELYSAEDIAKCMDKIQLLRYAEQASLEGCLSLTPYSSGRCIGASNWIIQGAYSSLTYISGCGVTSTHCANQDVSAFEDSQVVLVSGSRFSDASLQTVADSKPAAVEGDVAPRFASRPWITAPVKLFPSQGRPQNGKDFLGRNTDLDNTASGLKALKAAVDTINKGGSVLIPVDVSDKVLHFIENLSSRLAQAGMGKVPMFYISPSAEEFLAFTNTIPEWLSPHRQEKLFAGEPLFGHVELLKEKRLHHLPGISVPAMLELWQEPCVVLAGHSSLRMGPVVHLLGCWRERSECLLILTSESDVDIERMLYPYEPLAMQVQHLSFAPDLGAKALTSLLERLQLKTVMVPEILRPTFRLIPETETFFYSNRVPIEVRDPRDFFDLEISTELASRIKPKTLLKAGGAGVARLSADMIFHDHRYYLELPPISKMTTSPRQDYYSTLDVNGFLKALRDKNLVDMRVAEEDQPQRRTVISLDFPSSASIEVTATRTVINTSDSVLRRLITDAVTSVLQAV